LKDLFIGSAGTLGVITELTVRLHPIPEHMHTLRVFFPSIEAAAEAAYAVMGSGLPVARLELLDDLSIQSINRYLGRDYREAPALFIEFHSSTAAAIENEVTLAEELVRDAGATDIAVARTQEQRTEQWEARHHVYWALVTSHPGHIYTITDTAVPLAQLPAGIAYAKQLMREMNLEGGIVGHVGDGNFHTVLATGPAEYERAHAYSQQLVMWALSHDGTASGEHGIGMIKRPYMVKEHGTAVEWMRRVKSVFDPDGLLNPGKII
jgi:D-lactate dehydrogenase (cytochrome)